MEIASIKPNHRADLDFALKPSSHTKTIVVATGAASSVSVNGINNNNCNISAAEFTILADIEMITFQAAANYTSLKDLIPSTTTAAATPSSVMPPSTNSSRIDSWREIPIKDPLLQHAAWAYLQPMAPDHEADARKQRRRRRRRSFAHNLKDQCSNLFGCFNDVVLGMVKGWFPSSAAPAGRRQEEDREKGIAAASSPEEDNDRG